MLSSTTLSSSACRLCRRSGTGLNWWAARLTEASPANLHVEETMLSAAERVVELSR